MLDKSKMDWQDFKKTDKEIQEELEAHARSDKQYLDKKVRGAGSLMRACEHVLGCGSRATHGCA